MPFDIGFDFRSSAVFVTDPSYGVPVIKEVFPHLYTASNGFSINAGWDSAGADLGRLDVAAGNDPRIAGCQFVGNTGVPRTFIVDLGSGSAPGAGAYRIDLALGIAPGFGFQQQSFQLKDDTVVLIDGTSDPVTNDDHYIDATLADVLATITWTGATVTKTFASTTARLLIAVDNVGVKNTTLAHFRLTLVPAAAGAARPTPAQLRRQELLGVRGWHG